MLAAKLVAGSISDQGKRRVSGVEVLCRCFYRYSSAVCV